MPNRIIIIGAAALPFLLFCLNALYPRDSSTELYRKAARLAASGELDSAIPIFKRVIEVSPCYCMGHYGLGKAYLYKQGMLQEAIKHLRTSVNLDRKFVKGHFYLGVAYFLAKKYRLAASAFKAAYSFDASYVEALYNLGAIYEIIGKRYESQVYFTRYLTERVKKEEDVIF
ncbi:MAG: hypothetical protein A2W19_14385 [Spirochaetes bacterium RBG_16_49_21]|nr:MAG: hypothetical protein A2W19_14385 [Spirochaetes bacterium RBG_16_49_21]